MMKTFASSILVASCIAGLSLFTACGSSGDDDDAASTGGTGGTSGGTGGVAACPGPTDSVFLKPSSTGWVDKNDSCNTIGIQGAWYPYGDQYGAAKCTGVGMHPATDCSVITAPPPPPATGFENVDGKMCTSGEVAVILTCMDGVTTEGCPDHDYQNMWGAGIGFDFNADGAAEDGTPGAKHVWDPMAVTPNPITGISFVIDAIPLPGLRVEFPIVLTDDEAAAAGLPAGSTTDDHKDGAPYWYDGTPSATGTYKNSPVVANAVNVIHWADIKPPRTNYTFETSKMLGIQFHVPAVSSAPKGAYSFCISELTFVRD